MPGIRRVGVQDRVRPRIRGVHGELQPQYRNQGRKVGQIARVKTR